MQTLTFTTNLKCGGCVAAITPGLDAIPEIEKWEVNLLTDEKTLTIEATADVTGPVLAAFGQAGYQATPQPTAPPRKKTWW